MYTPSPSRAWTSCSAPTPPCHRWQRRLTNTALSSSSIPRAPNPTCPLPSSSLTTKALPLPCTPCCSLFTIVVSGFIPSPYWSPQRGSQTWNFGQVPSQPGDRALEGIFGFIWPAIAFAPNPFPWGAYTSNDPPASPFAMSSITPRYAPNAADVYYAASPLPYGRFPDRNAAREHVEAGRVDHTPRRTV